MTWGIIALLCLVIIEVSWELRRYRKMEESRQRKVKFDKNQLEELREKYLKIKKKSESDREFIEAIHDDVISIALALKTEYMWQLHHRFAMIGQFENEKLENENNNEISFLNDNISQIEDFIEKMRREMKKINENN